MKKFIIVILSIFISVISAQAFELDMSVDENIKKNYNSSKLEKDILPSLPEVLKQPEQNQNTQNLKTQIHTQTNIQDVPKEDITTDNSKNGYVQKPVNPIFSSNSMSLVKIGKGTKFKVKSLTKVSDWNSAGARMTFVSMEPVTKRYLSFPVGTTFKGVIEESHQPNCFGNGGLLKLKADNIIINGANNRVDAKIIKADGKHIFFNNIKGKRGYIKGMASQVKKGENFYNKTRSTSKKMSSNPVGTILSPIPTIVGVVGYGANLMISPITAIWSKGSHITLPAGTLYTLKLRQDMYVNR